MKMTIRSVLLAAIAAILPLVIRAGSETIGGCIWYYYVNGDTVVVDSVLPVSGERYNAYGGPSVPAISGVITIPATLGGKPVSRVVGDVFRGCDRITSVTIPDSVQSIGVQAFRGCYALRNVVIGNGVATLGEGAFDGCSGYTLTLKTSKLQRSALIDAKLNGASKVYCPHAISYDVAFAVGGMEKIAGFTDGTIFPAEIVSARMRENDPTVMDITYIVHSSTNVVNVRALAFEDGERGFATVVRPETFIEGTDANLGDGIAANVEHRLSWKVSSDWATDLAKVKFEVLAMNPGDLLLPMHFVTIPAAEGHPKTIVSVNDMSSEAYGIRPEVYEKYYSRWEYGKNGGLRGCHSIINVLFWFYASDMSDLSLSSGALWWQDSELVRHEAFAYVSAGGGSFYWSLNPNAFRYVFSKMGYRLLEDQNELMWINDNTRLNLQPQQFRQYAVKTVEE